MIVDSSAIVAVFFGEAETADLRRVIHDADDLAMPAPAYLETAMVCDSRRSPRRGAGLDDLLDALGIRLVPFTPEHARIARTAFAVYGRGSGHPARLNFGDCMSYAVAVAADEPLLFKGDDFTHTDVRDARAESGD